MWRSICQKKFFIGILIKACEFPTLLANTVKFNKHYLQAREKECFVWFRFDKTNNGEVKPKTLSPNRYFAE